MLGNVYTFYIPWLINSSSINLNCLKQYFKWPIFTSDIGQKNEMRVLLMINFLYFEV